ncbi:MAG: hypothetical protein PVG53_02205 [Holophagae bacterium]
MRIRPVSEGSPVTLPSLVLIAIVIVVAGLLGTCHRSPDEPVSPESSTVVAVDFPDLGVRLAIDTAVFDAASDGTSRPVIETGDPTDPGRIEVDARPPDDGQNLPAAVAEHRTFIEHQDGGRYLGAQELVSQLGPAFFSRGRYATPDGEIEETVVFALHPAGGRMITLTYRYPADDDSSARVEQLIEVLGTVETL